VNGQQTLGSIFVRNAHQDVFPTVWLYGDVAVRLIDPPASPTVSPCPSPEPLAREEKIVSAADVLKKRL
jgi:hypothetical protein